MTRIKTIAATLAVATLAIGAQAVAAPIGTVAGSLAPTSVMCTEEDGSTPGQVFPCRWDARLQGNGVGESFVILAAAE